jgi:hypothetical protein
MYSFPRQYIFPVIALALALLAGLLVALPNTQGSTPAAPVTPDAKAFLAYILYLEPDDFTTYTHPVQGFSFLYPKDYVLSTSSGDEGETVRAVSPRFVAGIEVISSGPVASVVWEEGTRPLVVVRPHPSLGHVADAWFLDGTDLYHVRAYAPHAEWLEADIREFLLSRFTFASGSHPGEFLFW